MTYTAGRCQISLRADDLGESAESLLVRFENCVERVLRCSDKLRRGLLFAESRFEIGVRFPDFAHGGIARASELVLSGVEFGLGHFHLVTTSETVKDRHTDGEERTEGWFIVSERFGAGDTDIEFGLAHMRI